jgi:hypothetical protein
MLATLFNTVSGVDAAEMPLLCYRRLHDKAASSRCPTISPSAVMRASTSWTVTRIVLSI